MTTPLMEVCVAYDNGQSSDIFRPTLSTYNGLYSKEIYFQIFRKAYDFYEKIIVRALTVFLVNGSMNAKIKLLKFNLLVVQKFLFRI